MRYYFTQQYKEIVSNFNKYLITLYALLNRHFFFFFCGYSKGFDCKLTVGIACPSKD